MISFIDWFIPLLVGSTFIALGFLKLYGALREITGGPDKPIMVKLCGT